MGRPTKYNQEMLEKAKHYLENYEEMGDKIPSIDGLAFFLEIHRDTVYDWAKHEDKKDFSDTLERINNKQKIVLLNKGLSGEFNSNITKLALGNHGFSDKHQQELSGPEKGPIELKGNITFVPAKLDEAD